MRLSPNPVKPRGSRGTRAQPLGVWRTRRPSPASSTTGRAQTPSASGHGARPRGLAPGNRGRPFPREAKTPPHASLGDCLHQRSPLCSVFDCVIRETNTCFQVQAMLQSSPSTHRRGDSVWRSRGSAAGGLWQAPPSPAIKLQETK